MISLHMKYLDWDSEQLGVHCGLIDGMGIEDYPVSNDIVNGIIKLINQNESVQFITIKLPSSCVGTVNALLQKGALLIDSELTFSFPKGESTNSIAIPDGSRFEFCKEIDCRPFLALAKEMRFSRFFLDSHISSDKAIYLWRTSIKNHCEGFADQLLISYMDDEPCGIVTLKFRDSEQLFLHIVGVLKKYQRKKVGLLMLDRIIEHYAEAYSIYIETQSNNIRAQAVYQKSGFKYNSLKYVMHYWRHK